jgi:NRPS condensation-like uncharacterized protein
MLNLPYSDNYQKPTMLKPLFIIFNVVTYTAYLLTILSFTLSSAQNTVKNLQAYYQVVCALNGVCFMILTATILNFGTKLEKVVKSIKIKMSV